MAADLLRATAFGLLAAAGLVLTLFAGRLAAAAAQRSAQSKNSPERAAARAAAKARRSQRSLSPLMVVQIISTGGGMALGWFATELAGMALLMGGLGLLLPPFMAAPARRRRQSRQALAWATWSRQLAELARAGSGLIESLRGSVEHAPPEIAATVSRVAATAELSGLETAIDELALAGRVWEPEVAAGLRMSATSGGAIADPLLDLSARIGDVVDLHRSKTEAVVQLWTQTIALLCLAGGVVVMMYRNNPAYFEPYQQGTGQLVFVGISGLLLFSTGFLVYHSVVREEYSVLVLPRRRSRAKDPL